jgi:hypothetical protein
MMLIHTPSIETLTRTQKNKHTNKLCLHLSLELSSLKALNLHSN